ncbi:hypothetical protein GCM10010428_56650 [Actinosynnema pretiosum subsp. pretiosum]
MTAVLPLVTAGRKGLGISAGRAGECAGRGRITALTHGLTARCGRVAALAAGEAALISGEAALAARISVLVVVHGCAPARQ